jgi:hypothetical protein
MLNITCLWMRERLLFSNMLLHLRKPILSPEMISWCTLFMCRKLALTDVKDVSMDFCTSLRQKNYLITVIEPLLKRILKKI